MRRRSLTFNIQTRLVALLSSAQILAFFPTIILVSFWLGGEPALIVVALIFPCLVYLSKRHPFGAQPLTVHEDDTFETSAQNAVQAARRHLRRTACLIIEVDDFDALRNRHGQSAMDQLTTEMLHRLEKVLRRRDQVFGLGDGQFGITLSPVRQLDTNVVLQMAARLQVCAERPVTIDATTIYVSASVGVCHDRQVNVHKGPVLAEAAGLALLDARRHRPSAVRSFDPDLEYIADDLTKEHDEVLQALENGDICAWFQPQVSTETGQVCGFEALARWKHPRRGIVPPNDFLPLITRLGKTHILGTKILRDSLGALKKWDSMGFGIRQVGVNFSPEELRDPKLVDRIVWELDQVNLTPDRLAVEILETVVASTPDDTITRNIRRLAEMGCYIDLDDFGTGHASISSIRRFAVQRLKIDRSFVTKVDCDMEQQRMVNAIQLMAEQLNLETLAEGVETAGEHAMLGQLGCQYVQGFGLGKPMPMSDTIGWVQDHIERVQMPPEIQRRSGQR